MNRSDAPTKQGVPFGVNGNRNPILPTTPAGDNSASYDAGFPPITMILKSAGGLPPKGQDMNEILYELSALARWASAGAINRFDSAFAAAIGGYPQDAQVLGSDGKTVWRSSTNNNTNDPNSVATGWVKVADDISSILSLGTASKKDFGTSSGQIPDMSSFSGQLTTNGYKLIPGGFIIQWGLSAPSTGGSDPSITFPIPFPNGVLHLVTSDYINVSNRPVDKTLWQVNAITKFGFQALNCGAIRQSSSGGVPSFIATIGASCPWFAIGY